MTKDEMKNRISLALKDPILQQGFECICKDLAISEHDREHNDYELVEVYKKVEQLEKENAELKKKVENLQKYLDTRNCYRECAETWLKLAKAKELIKNIIRVTWGEGWNYSLDWKVKAEQFLNSEVEK